MVKLWQRLVPGTSAALALLAVVALSACGPQPAYQIVQSLPPARTGTVESVREVVEQNCCASRARGQSAAAYNIGAGEGPVIEKKRSASCLTNE